MVFKVPINGLLYMVSHQTFVEVIMSYRTDEVETSSNLVIPIEQQINQDIYIRSASSGR